MMKRLLTVTMALLFGIGSASMANATGEHGGHGSKTSQEKMDHGSQSGHESGGHGSMGNTFSHEAVVDGIRAEFQVMSLDEMKMNDPEGNTHHVMVKFFDQSTKEQITKVIGKIKVITPSGKEQVASLKDYSGSYAANFTVEEKGKHGIICLFKINDNKHLIKFWYKPG